MSSKSIVYIVDDDSSVRDSLRWLVESIGLNVETFCSAVEFLENCQQSMAGCLVLDVRMKGLSGLELQAELVKRKVNLPIIFITGYGDVPMAVQAMQAGAMDFITKPFNDQALLDKIQIALEKSRQLQQDYEHQKTIDARLRSLTAREREVMEKVVQGKLNKVIAAELTISSKTVEAHRAKVMDKMRVKNIAELVQVMTSFKPTKQ